MFKNALNTIEFTMPLNGLSSGVDIGCNGKDVEFRLFWRRSSRTYRMSLEKFLATHPRDLSSQLILGGLPILVSECSNIKLRIRNELKKQKP